MIYTIYKTYVTVEYNYIIIISHCNYNVYDSNISVGLCDVELWKHNFERFKHKQSKRTIGRTVRGIQDRFQKSTGSGQRD